MPIEKNNNNGKKILQRGLQHQNTAMMSFLMADSRDIALLIMISLLISA